MKIGLLSLAEHPHSKLGHVDKKYAWSLELWNWSHESDV